MFTGIIKEVGQIRVRQQRSGLVRLGILSKAIYKEASVSDSISVNGVCLTVTEKQRGILYFDAVSSTCKQTNLCKVKIGEFVNIEPALKVGDQLGGHFLLGHIDCQARLKKIIKHQSYRTIEIDLPVSSKKHIVFNGSVGVEGISLSVKKIFPRSFTADVIPYTYQNTNLHDKKIGAWLNIEFDYLLKKS